MGLVHKAKPLSGGKKGYTIPQLYFHQGSYGTKGSGYSVISLYFDTTDFKTMTIESVSGGVASTNYFKWLGFNGSTWSSITSGATFGTFDIADYDQVKLEYKIDYSNPASSVLTYNNITFS